MTLRVDDSFGFGPNMQSYSAPLMDEKPDDTGYWSAAFRMESDVYNLWQGIRPPTFTPDPNFDFNRRMTKSFLFNAVPDSFIGVSSDAEWDAVEAKVAAELKDRATLQAAGWSGIAAQMVAGVLSPTILIPAGSVATAGKVSIAAGKAASWAVVGTAATEAVLQQQQETRTLTESAINIGGAAVMAGVLGGAIRWVDPLDIDKMASRMVDPQERGAILPYAPDPVRNEMPKTVAEVELKYTYLGRIRNDLAATLEPITDDTYQAMGAPMLKALGINSADDLAAIVDDPKSFNPSMAQLRAALDVEAGPKADLDFDAPIFREFGDDVDDTVQELMLRKAAGEKVTAADVKAGFTRKNSDWLVFTRDEVLGMAKAVGGLTDEEAVAIVESVIKRGNDEFAKLAVKEGLTADSLPAYVQKVIREEVQKATAGPKTGQKKWADERRAGLSAQKTPEEDLPDSLLPFVDPRGFVQLLSENNSRRFPLFGAINKLGPITRGIGLGLTATRRKVTAQFGSAGLHTRASAEGMAVAAEGDIESRIAQHSATFATANQEIQSLFKEWWLGKGGSAGSAKFRQFFKGGSYKDFLNEIGDAVRMRIAGRSHPLEAVNTAAEIFLTRVFRPLVDDARALGIEPFNKMSPEFALQVVTQKVRAHMVETDRLAAKAILKENALLILSKNNYTLAELQEEGLLGRVFRVTEANDPDLDDTAEQIADTLIDSMLGNERRSGMVDIFQQLGEKRARFVYLDPFKVWANGRTWNEFLERDAEKIARSFTRSMGPDVELWRTFGTNRPDEGEASQVPFWTEFKAELKVEYEKAALLPEKQMRKRLVELNREAQQFQTDLAVLVGRLRHTHGMPDDPSAIGTRLGRYALQLNTMRLMGSVVLSSIPDLARPVMKYGLLNTFRDGIVPMLTEFKNFKMLAKEAQFAGAALDVQLHGRAGALADMFDEIEYGSWLDRAMQYGTSRVGLIGLFDYWNSGLKQFSAVVGQSKMLNDIEAVVKGKASKQQKAFLGSLNINEATAKRLWKQITEQGGGTEVKPGVWLPNTDDWHQISDEKIKALAKIKAQEAIRRLSIDDPRTRYRKPEEVAKGRLDAYVKPKKDADGNALPAPTAAQLKEYTLKVAGYQKNLSDAQGTGFDLTILHNLAMFKDVDDLVAAKDLSWPVGAKTKEQRYALVADVMVSANVPNPRNKSVFGAWTKSFREGNRVKRLADRDGPEPTEAEISAFENDAWSELNADGRSLQRVYRAAIKRTVEDTIVTPGLERPNWVDSTTAGRLIAQFRSFTLSSTFKIVNAAAQDMKLGNYGQVMTGATMSLALGMVSYYLWGIAAGGEAKKRMLRELDKALAGDEDALGRWADEAIARSGLLGVFAEGMKFAERVPGTSDYVTFGNEMTSRSPFTNPVVELLGPSFGGLVPTLGRIVATLDDPSSETFRKGKQLMPYQNHLIFRQFFDRINENLMDAAGVSYK